MKPQNIAVHTILAMLPLVVAFIVQWLFLPNFQPQFWFPFYPAVFLSAWIGGLVPGLLSTFVSVLAVWWFFIAPQFSFSLPTPVELVYIGVFSVMGVFFSITLDQLKKTIKRADEVNDTLRASEEKLSVTLNSIGDGVVATDANGRVTRLNMVAERLTGWHQTEAVGRPVDEVFRIINQETRLPATTPVLETLAHGTIQGLANHTTDCTQWQRVRYCRHLCAHLQSRWRGGRSGAGVSGCN